MNGVHVETVDGAVDSFQASDSQESYMVRHHPDGSIAVMHVACDGDGVVIEEWAVAEFAAGTWMTISEP